MRSLVVLSESSGAPSLVGVTTGLCHDLVWDRDLAFLEVVKGATELGQVECPSKEVNDPRSWTAAVIAETLHMLGVRGLR